MAAALAAVAIPAGAEEATEVAVHPLVQVSQGQVTACGYLFVLDGRPVEYRLDRRDGGTRVAISAPEGDAAGLVVGDGQPDCDHSFPAHGLGYDGTDAATRDRIGERFRAVAIRGATVCRRDGDGLRTARVPGPLPNQVRAAFLNCTGDLYRQNR